MYEVFTYIKNTQEQYDATKVVFVTPYDIASFTKPNALITHQDLELSLYFYPFPESFTIEGLDFFNVNISNTDFDFIAANYRGGVWKDQFIYVCEYYNVSKDYLNSKGSILVKKFLVEFSTTTADIVQVDSFTAPVKSLKNSNATVLAASYCP